MHHGLDQLFHFLGQQRRTVEFNHLQGAVHLMDIGEAETQTRGVLRMGYVGFQCLPGLVQGCRNFAFDPIEGDIIMPITHSHS